MDIFPFDEFDVTSPIIPSDKDVEMTVADINDIELDIACLTDITKYYAQSQKEKLTEEYKNAVESLISQCALLQKVVNYYFTE